MLIHQFDVLLTIGSRRAFRRILEKFGLAVLFLGQGTTPRKL
jgi:hypothetical protein